MKFTQIELNELKSVLGDNYDDVREFFFNVCISKFDYKILITRRSYVLYKIFESIFHDFHHEIPDGNKFEIVGNICNSHSLRYLKFLKPYLDKKTFLIVDDIIINGRTIQDIYDSLKSVHVSNENIKIWAMVCSSKALCINDELKKMFGHIKYVPEEEWKSFSNVLTESIISSNVGYVSFVNSYRLYNIPLEHILKSVENDTVYDNSNSIFEKYKIDSKVVFWDFNIQDEIKKFNIKSCIRLYQKNDKVIVVPYVFLPSLAKKETYGYCSELLSVFGIPIPVFFNEINDCYISFYQWTIKVLSSILIDEFSEKLNLEYSVLFDCHESYLFDENKIEVNQTDNKTSYIYDYVLDSQNEHKSISILNENVEENVDFSYILKMYLKQMRQVDDERAENKEKRCLGIRVSNIQKCINAHQLKCSERELLTLLVNLWDCGKASFVIMEDFDKDNHIIDGFLRHGEQIYMVYYEIFSEVYNVFYELFCQTFESRKEKLYEMAKYFDNNKYTNLFTEFVNGINYKHYVTDLMAIDPLMLSSDFIVKDVQKEVKIYLELKNREM